MSTTLDFDADHASLRPGGRAVILETDFSGWSGRAGTGSGCRGDARVDVACDLADPPRILPEAAGAAWRSSVARR